MNSIELGALSSAPLGGIGYVLVFPTFLNYFLAAWAAPAVGSYISEEPMVVAALAIQAGAAFIGAQVFSLAAAAVLVAAAGFAWGTAKFGFG